jgi:ligand-binding sensor domain-containing protein
MPRSLFFLLAAVLATPLASAQDLQMRFHSIGQRGFLTVQDSTGFIWTVGGGGVRRYDGVRTVEYRYDSTDSTSIPSDAIEPLIASRRGGVWLGTLENGIAWFDPGTETFRRYLPGEYVMRLLEYPLLPLDLHFLHRLKSDNFFFLQ